MQIRRWFKLDNAAKLYPAVSTQKWSSVFRLSAELIAPVDPLLLQKAVDQVLPRFPSFQVRMRSGFFWHYLEEIPCSLTVRPDTGHPCMPFRHHQDHGYLMRVMYFGKRISAEFFHSLTDGNGGLIFIKTLTAEYLRLSGHSDIQFDHGALNIHSSPSPEETEDAFIRLHLPHVRVSRSEKRAYHLPATPEIPHTLHLIAASMPCGQVLQLAHRQRVTLTEYLVSVMLFTAYQTQLAQRPHRKRPIRISVPVNMRRYFHSSTLRNFSSFINPGIDPRLGHYSFQEICRHVHSFMQYQLDPKLLCATISTNVADEKNLLIRLSPLWIKDWVISGVFHRSGDRIVTGTLSNLGKAEMPTGTENLVRRFEFHLGVPASPLWNCGMITNGDEIRLIFSGNIMETDFPRGVLHFLVDQGIAVEIESNREEK